MTAPESENINMAHSFRIYSTRGLITNAEISAVVQKSDRKRRRRTRDPTAGKRAIVPTGLPCLFLFVTISRGKFEGTNSRTRQKDVFRGRNVEGRPIFANHRAADIDEQRNEKKKVVRYEQRTGFEAFKSNAIKRV